VWILNEVVEAYVKLYNRVEELRKLVFFHRRPIIQPIEAIKQIIQPIDAIKLATAKMLPFKIHNLPKFNELLPLVSTNTMNQRLIMLKLQEIEERLSRLENKEEKN